MSALSKSRKSLSFIIGLLGIVLCFTPYYYWGLGTILLALILILFIPREVPEEMAVEPLIAVSEISAEDKESINKHIQVMLSKLAIINHPAETHPADLLIAHQELVHSMEILNSHDLECLLQANPEFSVQLQQLNLDWNNLKEQYKLLSPEILQQSLSSLCRHEQNIADKLPSPALRAKHMSNFFQSMLAIPDMPEQLKDFSHQQLSICQQEIPVDNEIALPTPLSTLPDALRDLLWFADGPLANYASTEINNQLTEAFLEVNLCTTPLEPSLISIDENIATNTLPLNTRVAEELTYSAMSPEERATYLKVLSEFKSPNIDISWFSLFITGLERRLFTADNYQEAAKILVEIAHLHHNKLPLLNRIYDLLIYTTLIRQDGSLLKYLLDNKLKTPSSLAVSAMLILKLPLTIDLLCQISTMVGFNNKRYLKLYPDLFTSFLQEEITNHYGNDTIPLSLDYFAELPLVTIQASHSPAFSHCEVKLADIKQSSQFKTDMLDLLQSTHNRIKEHLKAQRRKS